MVIYVAVQIGERGGLLPVWGPYQLWMVRLLRPPRARALLAMMHFFTSTRNMCVHTVVISYIDDR